jgi:hypothetical protein
MKKLSPVILAIALLGAGCEPTVVPAASLPTTPAVTAPAPTNSESTDSAVAPAPTSAAATKPVTNSPAPVAQKGKSRSISFKAMGDEKVSGSAIFLETANGLEVATSLKGTSTGMTYSANIETGSCAQRGSVAYPLKNLIKGYAYTLLSDLRLEHVFTSEKTLSIKIKPTDASPYIACADIK